MQTLELIDKYIDNELSQTQIRLLETDLEHDAELQQLLDSVIIARKAVRIKGLTVKVKGLHERYIDELRSEEKQDNVRPMPISRTYSWITRIAATVLIGLLGYQYASLNSPDLYQAKFIPYQLPTTRGSAEQSSNLNLAYKSGKYATVIQQFNTLTNKVPSDYFLAGIAHLQQKNYHAAVTTFNALRQYNKQRTESYFEQETDYYLALALLGDNRTAEAYELFKTIHNSPRHLFSESITELDLLKLNLLRLRD